jgi:hypothetical protein
MVVVVLLLLLLLLLLLHFTTGFWSHVCTAGCMQASRLQTRVYLCVYILHVSCHIHHACHMRNACVTHVTQAM